MHFSSHRTRSTSSRRLSTAQAYVVEGPPDRLATRRVREMIACRANLQIAGLAVEVRNGTATLRGCVESEADAHEAARLAGSVVTVMAVEPCFDVRPPLGAEARQETVA